MCSSPATRLPARAAEAAKLEGVKKVLLAEAPRYEHALAEPMAALIVSLAGAYAPARAGHHQRQERACRGSPHCST